jgi:circadian clock protein KaiC
VRAAVARKPSSPPDAKALAKGSIHGIADGSSPGQVRKLRGGGFRSGRHAYWLSREGLHLFPRLADLPAAGEYPLGSGRISSGLDALDTMLADGFWPGAATLVAGPTGSGKTVMGLHFIFAGARRGEPGVIATLQENPTQLQRMIRGLGWPADDPAIEVMYRSPVDIYVDEWVYAPPAENLPG